MGVEGSRRVFIPIISQHLISISMKNNDSDNTNVTNDPSVPENGSKVKNALMFIGLLVGLALAAWLMNILLK